MRSPKPEAARWPPLSATSTISTGLSPRFIWHFAGVVGLIAPGPHRRGGGRRPSFGSGPVHGHRTRRRRVAKHPHEPPERYSSRRTDPGAPSRPAFGSARSDRLVSRRRVDGYPGRRRRDKTGTGSRFRPRLRRFARVPDRRQGRLLLEYKNVTPLVWTVTQVLGTPPKTPSHLPPRDRAIGRKARKYRVSIARGGVRAIPRDARDSDEGSKRTRGSRANARKGGRAI